ncbi:MAG: HDOD domain-containing protein [Chitinispirillales bacterium]|jgi:HD-like signal output (HDOD) protein|nr:HDOD domain-containing protein [Chitinispirillales bacterium]
MNYAGATGIQPGTKERVAHIVENVDRLPALPAIVLQLMRVVNCSKSSVVDAAKLIAVDPVLTSKVIRLANSSFYGIPRTVSSLPDAIVILGFNTIRSLVLGLSVAKMFHGNHSLNMDRFWKHSIITAIAAKIIARHLRKNVMMIDPESAFSAGILHDLGKLIFSQYVTADYIRVCGYADRSCSSILEAEDELLGINHTEVGKTLAVKWALPPDLGSVLMYHHRPQEAAEEASFLVNVIHLADIIAHTLECNLFDGEVCELMDRDCLAELKMDKDEYDKLLHNVENSIEKSQEFLSTIMIS